MCTGLEIGAAAAGGAGTAAAGGAAAAAGSSFLSSLAAAAATAGIGALVSQALAPKQPDQVVSPIGESEKPKQAAKEPDVLAIKKQNALQAAASPGYSSTLLTGSSGVSNSSLGLGRNTLLGS